MRCQSRKRQSPVAWETQDKMTKNSRKTILSRFKPGNTIQFMPRKGKLFYKFAGDRQVRQLMFKEADQNKKYW